MLAAASAAGTLAAAPEVARAAGQVEVTLERFAAANPGTSALVWRLDGPGRHTEVASVRPDAPRIPASNMKLVTGAGALLQFGPRYRYTTIVATRASARVSGGTLAGPLYLMGSGDPLLATRSYSARYLPGRSTPIVELVKPLRAAGITRVAGPIVADESLFDSRRVGPTWPGYYAAYSQPLSALATNQNYAGETRDSHSPDPPRSAATRLRAALRGVRIAHSGPLRTGTTPQGTRVLASVMSPPMSRVVREMNVPSDNFIAEMLTKSTGAYGTGQGSTAGGTARTTQVLTQMGILTGRERLVDGSGLSRQNRLTATALVRLIAAADADRGWGAALIASLPKGGEGTLVNRMRTGVATNRVRAKTGYIDGASSLSGRVVSRRGVHYAFSMLMNTQDITGAKATQDRVVTLLAAGAED